MDADEPEDGDSPDDSDTDGAHTVGAHSAGTDTDGPDDGPWRRRLEVLGLVVLGLVVFAFLTAAVPQLVGADHSFVVQSDSMSPSIGAGSMLYVDEVPATAIETGDVITFRESGENSARITHRVVEVTERDGRPAFRTKGDANPEPDQDLVTAEQVVGVAQFHLPYLGSAVVAVQSPVGILALIVLPAVALAALEVWDLYSATATDGDPATREDAVDSPETDDP